MAGIHLHQHDLADEGAAAIAPWLARLDDLTHLFVQVNDIFERNPSPSGILPRNPVHPVVVGSGQWFADLDLATLSPALHQQRRTGLDPLTLVQAAGLADDYAVVPWINLLNGSWTGDVLGNCVVDLAGRPVQRWLCPNGPQVRQMWSAVLRALLSRYPYRRYLIDRIRYPDWSGEEVEPRTLLCCFCTACVIGMQDAGIDVVDVRHTLGRLQDLVGEAAFEDAVDLLLGDPVARAWIDFRQNSVTRLVASLTADVRRTHPDAELWLDLWPPAYAWLLGQDYRALTALSPRLKHFPYHRLGGGADVLSLIDSVAHDEAEHDGAFAAFSRLFDLDYGITLGQFRADGFPIALVADQNRRVADLAVAGTFVWSGVQMWNVAASEVYRAAQAAYASADDVIYYCYGWAADDLFGAANVARSTGRHATGSRGAGPMEWGASDA